MIWFGVGFVAVVVLTSAGSARAQSIPATLTTVAPVQGWFYSAGDACSGEISYSVAFESHSAACEAHSTFTARRYRSSCFATNVTGVNKPVTPPPTAQALCVQDIYDNGNLWRADQGYGSAAPSGPANVCPSEFTLDGGVCKKYSCPADYVLAGTVCNPVPCTGVQIRDIGGPCRCPAAGNAGDAQIAGIEYLKFTGNTPSSPWCEGGCQVVPGQVVCATSGGVRTCWATGNRGTGQTCASATPALDPAPLPADQPIIDCVLSGRTWGTVNGVGVCMPIGTPGQTNSATGPSTSGTTTNPDGSTTTTESRTERQCSNGVCVDVTTTTTTTRNAQGQTTGTTTETTRTELPLGTRGPAGSGAGSGSGSGDGQGPEEDPSAFGGSCVGGFSCSGDAIQCAIASEQHRRNCETLSARTSLTQAAADASVNDAVAGTGTGPDFLPRTTVDMSSINTGARINAGSCPAPVAVATPLGSFSVNLTNLCAPLEWFGLIILAASVLVAGRITFGGL